MLSFAELLLVVLVALLIFAPEKLTGIGRSLGEAVRDFKKALDGKSDIDITETAKRLPDDEKSDS